MMARLLVLLVCVCAFVAGALVGAELVRSSDPWCPTEDSCDVDYRDGGWHVVEVTP